MTAIYLGVNIDHIATVRNARGTAYPEPVHAALMAEQAGADGITVHLREDRRHIIDRDVFILRDRHDFPVVMTQPWGVNGADMLPMSLVGCALWDIMAILAKQRQQVTAASGWAESVREPEPPWRYQRIHIHYRFVGANLKRAQLQRAITLSETKYCSIYATLAAAIQIESDFEIVEDSDARN